MKKRISSAERRALKKAVQRDAGLPPMQQILANGMDPKHFAQATHALGTLRRFAEFCQSNKAADIAKCVMPHENASARSNERRLRKWLYEFYGALELRQMAVRGQPARGAS